MHFFANIFFAISKKNDNGKNNKYVQFGKKLSQKKRIKLYEMIFKYVQSSEAGNNTPHIKNIKLFASVNNDTWKMADAININIL